jgi:hypothetical protein
MNYNGFSIKQKNINSIMTCILPFIRTPIIFSLTLRDLTIFELKEIRDKEQHDLHGDPPQSG